MKAIRKHSRISIQTKNQWCSPRMKVCQTLKIRTISNCLQTLKKRHRSKRKSNSMRKLSESRLSSIKHHWSKPNVLKRKSKSRTRSERRFRQKSRQEWRKNVKSRNKRDLLSKLDWRLNKGPRRNARNESESRKNKRRSSMS
jgi:hypothetical protein